jgi:DNA invertase Pin-like site-specific DNA recombinase
MAVVGYARVSTEDQSIEGGKSWIFRSSVALKSSARTLPTPIETLDTKGADFRSLGDPIDTTSPQGRFTLQTVTAERA